jgi:hypothetical protein
MRTSASLALALSLCAAPDARALCPRLDPAHSQWTALLARRVERGRVDYSWLLRDDRAALERYLAALSATCRADYQSWTRQERIAFWLNAYNAFTVQLILAHHPIDSIRSIGWLPGAAFRREFIPMPELAGGSISLDEIEHRTLRVEFDEPRIHFALVCAARSCPELRAEAYRGADLERQLEEQGRAFLRDPHKNRVDAARRTLALSPIFRWFREDFERDGRSLAEFVAPYLEPGTPDVRGFRIEFLDYDWSLNDR